MSLIFERRNRSWQVKYHRGLYFTHFSQIEFLRRITFSFPLRALHCTKSIHVRFYLRTHFPKAKNRIYPCHKSTLSYLEKKCLNATEYSDILTSFSCSRYLLFSSQSAELSIEKLDSNELVYTPSSNLA